ncbi:hypothetical protein SteCoe_29803 [Stentor coeruleus]|uniref:Uncharacterized protein n=1 Tax=Stentor coeruleus TaxID=5963 RepID=A0A1R2B553_9CILI|nr:hypothetical protein SteCoe_29803 [Stentor coeruleus]
MENNEDSKSQNIFSDNKEILNKIENSPIDEDQSNISLSKFSYDETNYKKRLNYSIPSDNAARSKEWNSYSESSFEAKESSISEDKLQNLKTQISNLQINKKNLIKQLKDKDKEILDLKSLYLSLQKKMNALGETVRKRDKEISKVFYENEINLNALEESKALIKSLKIKETKLTNKNTELKELYEFSEERKKHAEKELGKALQILNRLKRSLKLKDDEIESFQNCKISIDNDIGIFSKSLKHSHTNSARDIRIRDRKYSESPPKYDFDFNKKADNYSYKIMCHEAMKILGAFSNKDFYDKILHLKKSYIKNMNNRKLIEKISNMIIQCSPEGTFDKEPSVNYIWKWITGFLEEYMKIKKSITGEAFMELCLIMNTDDVEVMLKRVKKVLKTKSSRTKF